MPVVFGVLTCLDEKQAEKRWIFTNLSCRKLYGGLQLINYTALNRRSIGKDNHGVGWGKTAVEMGLLRLSALGESVGKVGI